MPTDLIQIVILSLAGVWSFGLHQRNPNGRLPLFLMLYLSVPIGGLITEHLIGPVQQVQAEWIGVFLNAGLTAALIQMTRHPFPFFPPDTRDPRRDQRATEARIQAYTLAYRALAEVHPLSASAHTSTEAPASSHAAHG